MHRWLALTAILAAPLWQSCSQAGDGAGKHPIVVVVFDGLRTDRLGSYGAGAALTPHLDRFANEALRFEWAFAQTPEADSSLASLVTGLYATSHGLVEEGDRLVEEAQTVAEALLAAGFATATFMERGPDQDDLGLAQGFDTIDWGPGALGAGLAWLEQPVEEDAFVLLGLPPLAGAVAGDEEAVRLYDERVAAADQAFGRVLAALDASGLAQRATVAVVSLVGAELGEHGADNGPAIYAQVTRVPLLLRSRRFSEPGTVDKIVELVDLMPTLLELVGEGAPPEVQGRSLVDLVEGPGSPPYIAFGESPTDGGRYFAALGGYRMVLHARDDVAELYDLGADPNELTDLATGDDKRVAVLREHLGAWQKMVAAASLDPERRIEELDDDTLDQLKSLGYIQ